MKITIPNFKFRMANFRRGRGRVVAGSQFAIRNSQFRSGIALVITLILLSVTLIMAVAFLAVARRERKAVSTTTDTAIARLATDAALAAAEAQIAVNLLATNNYIYNFNLLVSTNIVVNPAVPYNATVPEWATNLQPRPPVFVSTNGGLDFRYYLDLNRNGKGDANGWVADVDGSGALLGTTNFQVGDPEWIGVLERPDANPANNNKFIARYAFLAQPVGNTLDLNYIHNEANLPSTATMNAGSFRRNQGVGSWEINLGAFLYDLNTNSYAWGPLYTYDTGAGASGNGFIDALGIYSFRLNGLAGNLAYNTAVLNSANNYFGAGAFAAFANDLVDVYSDGPFQTTTALPTPDNDGSDVAYPWPGADNTNHFFALPSELFDPTKAGVSLTNHLINAGSGNGSANTSTYDRYTFYRLLAQMGTDSTADDGRMNLNYDNLDASGAVIPGAETNLIAWTAETNGALRFFTNAANRLLTNATAIWLKANPASYLQTFQTNATFSLTNIPVYINGKFVYTSAVNRLLQLAANMYDASTNSPYPSVFRPLFTTIGNNVFITSYTNLVGTNGNALSTPNDITAVAASGGVNILENVYGVPWIIGAKKGLPNFNQFNMLNTVEVTRKLQCTKPYFGAPLNLFQTNQMYIFSISNLIGCSLWNSYASAYPRPVKIVANDVLTVLLTNDDTGFTPYGFTNRLISIPITTNWAGTVWSDSTSTNPNPSTAQLDLRNNNSFVVPFNFTNSFVSQSIYRYAGYNGSSTPYFDTNMTTWQTFSNTTGNPTLGLTPPLPHFGLVATNRLQIYILDGTNVIDYVHFAGPDSYLDISGQLGQGSPAAGQLFLWNANPVSGSTTPQGVSDQILFSELGPTNNPLPFGLTSSSWVNPSGMQLPSGLLDTPAAEAAFFGGFFNVISNGQFIFGKVVISTGPSSGGSGGSGPSGGRGSGGNLGGGLGSGGGGGGPTGGSPGGVVTTDAIFFNTQLAVQAPYTPTRLIFTNISWQANDPLVHYLASDLNYYFKDNTESPSDNPDSALSDLSTALPNMTNLTARYSPWGQTYSKAYVNSSQAVEAQWSSLMKDPLVWRSDYWDFPTNKYPSVGWLGRVHRGTPWQTVYLKASDIQAAANGPGSWTQWTGDGNTFDAANSAPLADETLFDLFGTAPDINATHGTLSVNIGGGSADPAAGLAAWSAVFSGVVALTNTTAATPGSGYFVPTVGNTVIAPAGGGGTNSALGTLVGGINSLRAGFVNVDGLAGCFEHVGNVLRVPALTEQSPLLNWNDPLQQQYGISDELYEWLPQQTIGLLRVPTAPRYVIYCYGQTLRPAVNGINPATGMVTNYQIVAESAARAVIHLNKSVSGGVTNYTGVVESYNLLPPN